MAKSAPIPEPHPDLVTFLQRCKETPDDDVVRLVFADWLEEQGNPRGEFIRIQCGLARLPQGDPRCEDLQRRSDELTKRYFAEWGSMTSD